MCLALGALALLTGNCLAIEPALRFSIAESWAMPLIRVEQGQPVDGILYDLTQSLARQVDRPTTYLVLAKLRLQKAMDNGDIDIRCYVSQSWLPSVSRDYIWSRPLFYQRDLLIATAGQSAPTTPTQLARQSIGTVLGYTYPGLQGLFDSGRLVRDDARTQELVLQKLQAGRYRYAISNQLSLDWFNRQLPPQQQLQGVAVLEEHALGCYVRNDPALPVQRILLTLLRMRLSGEIDRIIARYDVSNAVPRPSPTERP